MENCEKTFNERRVESKHSLTANQYSTAGVSHLFSVLQIFHLASWDIG